MNKKNEIANLNIEEKIVLYRHWLWADHLKHEYGSQLRRRHNTKDISNLFGLQGAYMFMWYGLVYSMIEFMDTKNITIPEIKEDTLKMYESVCILSRNGVFHIQSELGFEKLFKMIGPGGSSVIFRIHDFIGSRIEETLVRTMLGISPKEETTLKKIMGNHVNYLKKKSKALKNIRETDRNKIGLNRIFQSFYDLF